MYMASYQKLNNGSWGAKVQGTAVRKGDKIAVQTKNGKTNYEIVDEVLGESSRSHVIVTLKRS